MSIRTILHPTDFSDCSRYAFRVAGMLAREQGARLIVVHVKPTLGPLVAYGEALAELEPEGSQERLVEVLHRLRLPDSKAQVEHRLVEGEAAEEILRQAEEVGADLIVMGTHGRTGIGRLLMGSVAGEVVRNSRCPVITVKIPHSVSPAKQPAAAPPVATKATPASP
jgi:nucleotide-binding universal stress UspA family protein